MDEHSPCHECPTLEILRQVAIVLKLLDKALEHCMTCKSADKSEHKGEQDGESTG